MRTKRLIVSIITLLCLIGLTGCVDYNITVNMMDNGGATVSMTVLYQDNTDLNADELKKAPKGWDEYSTYSVSDEIVKTENGVKLRGYKHTVVLNPMQIEEFMKNNVDIVDVEKFAYSTGIINESLEFNGESAINEKALDSNYPEGFITMFKDSMTIDFQIKTKFPIMNNNANIVGCQDGVYTYTWDLIKMYEENTKVMTANGNALNVPLILTLLIGLLLIIAAKATPVRKDSNKITLEQFESELGTFIKSFNESQNEYGFKQIEPVGDDFLESNPEIAREAIKLINKSGTAEAIDSHKQKIHEAIPNFSGDLEDWIKAIVLNVDYLLEEIDKAIENDKDLATSNDTDCIMLYSLYWPLKTLMLFVKETVEKLPNVDGDVFAGGEIYELQRLVASEADLFRTMLAELTARYGLEFNNKHMAVRLHIGWVATAFKIMVDSQTVEAIHEEDAEVSDENKEEL